MTAAIRVPASSRAPDCACRPRWGRAGEAGSVSVQLVILMPALFTLMFLGMQAALYHHARTVALAAAQEGARAAGGEGQTLTVGIATARTFVSDAGGADVLERIRVSGETDRRLVTVTVSGTSLSVIPGWHVTVTQSATRAREVLTDG